MIEFKYNFCNTTMLIKKAYLYKSFFIIAFLVWTNFDPYWTKFFLGFYLLNCLPAIYLHTEYLKANKNISYQLTESAITVNNLNNSLRYPVDDLQKIIIYMTPTIFKHSNFTTWSMEEYFYARIITTNGEEMIITCLYNADIKKFEEDLKILKDVEYIRRKEIFCTISLKYRG